MMGSRRSPPGVGQISLIYTVGREYQPQPSHRGTLDSEQTVLTASIGEDFADCSWPVTVKAHATTAPKQLRKYVEEACAAISEGFFMNPRFGAGMYWRWSGRVPPGFDPDKNGAAEATLARGIEIAAGTGTRSQNGHPCGIYLLDDATRWIGDGFCGTIQGTTVISGGVNEDYARTRWPVVIKVHPGVTRKRLQRYLSDLHECLANGLFYDAELVNIH